MEQRQKALEARRPADRAAVRQGLGHAHGRRVAHARSPPSRRAACRSTSRSASAACPRGRIVEIFGPESSGKTTLVYHVIAEAQKPRRPGGVHRRRARHGPRVREPHRRQRRRPAGLAARQRRAGAGDRRDARALRRARRRRDRLRGGPGAQGGDRGRDGRLLRRPAGAADEPGAAQADRRLNRTGTVCIFTNQLREKIGVMFGSPETTPGRPRAEVLRLGAPRHPPHRDAQGRRRGLRQPRARQGREEQDGAAVPPGRVRHHLRRGHLLGGLRPRRRRSRRASSRSRARTSRSARSGSGQGRANADGVPGRASRHPGGDPRARWPRSRA